MLFGFLQFLPKDIKLKLMGLFPFICLTSIFEVLGFASIAPILDRLSNPDLERNNRVVELLQVALPFDIDFGSVENLAYMSIALVVASFLFNSLTHLALNLVAANYGHRLTSSVMKSFLEKDYLAFRSLDKSTLCNDIIYEPQRIAKGILNHVVLFYQRVFSISFLAFVALYYSAKATVIMLLFFAVLYGVLYLLQKHFLMKFGKELSEANKGMNRTVIESYENFSEVKLRDLPIYFSRKLGDLAKRFYNTQAYMEFMGFYQKYLVEALCVTGVMFYLVYRTQHGSGEVQSSLISDLSFFVIIGYKLMPQSNDIFRYMVKLKSHQHAFEKLQSVAMDLQGDEVTDGALIERTKPPPVFKSELRLENVSFSYGDRPVIENFNFTLKKGEILGLYGSSGKGKTTLVNIIMGLLSPKAGHVYVDGQKISDLSLYRQLFSYVPQESFLLNATVAENLAFGVDSDAVDLRRLQRVSEMAEVSSIVDSLADKYETLLGEEGTSLSGGQKQRLAIARSLYFDQPIIVFDESTNSLDKATETQVLENLKSLATSGYTILMVTHNPEIREHFTRVVELEGS